VAEYAFLRLLLLLLLLFPILVSGTAEAKVLARGIL
jgi:hypothetical protein